MGRRRGRSPPRPVAAVARSEAPVGDHRSTPRSPTVGGETSTSRKRRCRSRGKKSTSTSKDASAPAESSIPRTDLSLANHGEILVLFETPSGFAIFCMKEHYLHQPNIWAIFGQEFRSQGIVWLKKFQIFKDKSSAINSGTGVVCRELAEMILRYHRPSQTLAVGKPEYKRIIEASLPGVACLFDETVMEVMWGQKNLMHRLVPQEEVKLTEEDRHAPMSKGLKMLLGRYGFDDVKQGMVNQDVVVAACLLRDAETIEDNHSKVLPWAADKLEDVSGIDAEGWGMMKIATALKIMFDPLETSDEDLEIFTRRDILTLGMDAHKYQDIIHMDKSLMIYSELVEMREVKKHAIEMLGFSLS